MPSRWAWVLQDALGITFCLYMLKTIRLPTFKVRLGPPLCPPHVPPTDPSSSHLLLPQACTLLLLVLFIYDVFFVFITPFLTKVGACPARLAVPTPLPSTHPDVTLLCRAGTASWWRWPPDPRTPPPMRRCVMSL